MELTDENYPYRHQLFCAECGYKLNRAVRAGRVLWECSGKARFSQDFCSGVCVTDDEVRSWLPLSDGGHYIFAVTAKGKITGHGHMPETRVYCKYCGSRLRRLINNSGTVTWICDGLSRKGKAFCKGIRVPDEKLKPLAGLAGNFYIGKEKVNGTESYGYSRKPDRRK